MFANRSEQSHLSVQRKKRTRRDALLLYMENVVPPQPAPVESASLPPEAGRMETDIAQHCVKRKQKKVCHGHASRFSLKVLNAARDNGPASVMLSNT